MNIPAFSLEAIQFWHWFVIAAAFMFVGFFVKGGFFPSFGLAALATGGVFWAMPTLPLHFQIGGFGALGVVIFLSTLLGGGSRNRGYEDGDEEEHDGYVGSVFMLEQATMGGEGSMTIRDELWSIVVQDGASDLPKGSLVKVKKRNGSTLFIEPASDIGWQEKT